RSAWRDRRADAHLPRQRVLGERGARRGLDHPNRAALERRELRGRRHLSGVLPGPPVHACHGHRDVRRRLALSLVTIGGVPAFAATPAASAQTREYWVAAVPVTWNMIPNQFDDITGTRFDPVQRVMPTVVYRRFTAHGGSPLANTPESGNQNLIPGPLLRARVGDRILVHFKNLDFALRQPHSRHLHARRYKPSSDGAYVPGVSGRDGD